MEQCSRIRPGVAIHGGPHVKSNGSRRAGGFRGSTNQRLLSWIPRPASKLGSTCGLGSPWGSWRYGARNRKRRNGTGMPMITGRSSHFDDDAFFAERPEPEQKSNVKTKIFETPSGIKHKIDPVGILRGMDPLTAKPLATFLRERYKCYKNLKEEIITEDDDLLEFSSAYEVLGIRRHPRHGIEVYDWAPGANFFSIIGDFNGWTHRANAMGKRYLGRDDCDHFRVFVKDKLREGEEEDDIYQEYNYASDYDKGDENKDMDSVFQKMNDEYWEPGEDQFVKKSPEAAAMEIFEEILNSNQSPQHGEREEEGEEQEEDSKGEEVEEEIDELSDSDEEDEWEDAESDPEALMNRYSTSVEDLDTVQRAGERDAGHEWDGGDQEDEGGADIDVQRLEMAQRMETNKQGWKKGNESWTAEDARTRYEKFRASPEYESHGLPPVDVIDDGTTYDEPHLVDDPVWRAKVDAKEQPYAYWENFVKGRKAWERKYIPGIPHLGRFREYFHTADGPLERVPSYATYVLPDEKGKYSAVFWDPRHEDRHKWAHKRPRKADTLRIYECHVGISAEDPRISTFADFSSKVLPWVKRAGYNTIQLIGVQEHVEYSSVGYKVTNMFAVSSRFGTPEDFKLLVDTAHGLGLLVFMDIVHSYGAPNESVGLSAYDGGSSECFFHTGRRGLHKRWGTRMFRYGEYEVVRYLLSNLKWWAEEYRIDGFHFHSVSSMLYAHNGFSAFENGVEDFCNQYVDMDAQIYLMLANEMLHQLNPNVVTIAEDVTMYPGVSQSLTQGGLGFDYYVNFLPAELWAQLAENVPLQDWSMTEIVAALQSDLSLGKALVFSENHIQSVVGGKSLAEIFLRGVRDPEQESLSSAATNGSGSIARSTGSLPRNVALLKMIKLLTLTLGGQAYLNFMGNEFGHPEWVEFPRSDNHYSYVRARRQWSLRNDNGVHSQMALFDRELMETEESHKILTSGPVTICHVDDSTKAIIYRRGRLLFAFNFHRKNYYEVYKVGVPEAGEYERLLDTDDEKFGGQSSLTYRKLTTARGSLDNFDYNLGLEMPPCSAQVYALVRTWDTWN